MQPRPQSPPYMGEGSGTDTPIVHVPILTNLGTLYIPVKYSVNSNL